MRLQRISSSGSAKLLLIVLQLAAVTRAQAPGTRRIDITFWRPSEGNWYVNLAAGGNLTRQWGLPGDIPVAADFDRDGKLDYVVFRPSEGNWYVTPSGGGAPYVRQWGLAGDIPVAGDFDGDGRADLAVWRPTTAEWWIIPSAGGGVIYRQWGLKGDVPLVADFDGDGKTDLAIWRPSDGSWWIIPSSGGSVILQHWGLPGDVPIAADFDGDGRADLAIWRPSDGYWWIAPSAGAPYTRQWGQPGDIPVARDYDLDRRADIAVWRPGSGAWYVVPSSAPSSPYALVWGASTDVPLYRIPGAPALDSTAIPNPPTPNPPGTPAPVINSFSAQATSITSGQSTTLTWSVSNASSVTIDNGIGSVAASGSRTVAPGASTTYTLTATGAGGSRIASVTISVSVPVPSACSISGGPANDTYFLSSSATLSKGSWWVQGFTLNATTTFQLRVASDYNAQTAVFAPDQLNAFENNGTFQAYTLFDNRFGTQSVTLNPGSYYLGIRNTSNVASNQYGLELDYVMSIPGLSYVDTYLTAANTVGANDGKLWQPFTVQCGFRYLMDGANSGLKTYIIPANQLAAFQSNQPFRYYSDYSSDSDDTAQPGYYEVKLPAGDYYLVFWNDTAVAKTVTYLMERWR